MSALQEHLTKLKNENRVLSKEEKEQNVAEWTLFYRQNLDLFNRDILGINLKEFQNDMIREMAEGEKTDVIASRGLSKTFTIGTFAVDMALLYPKSEILIDSETYTQANNVIDEKIDKELSGKAGISPFLKQLRADGYMTIRDDKKNGGKIVEFGNGSKIFSMMLGEGIRSFRATILINDEAVRLKKKDIDSIAEPTLRPRQIGCLANYPDYLEEPKIINATSAKSKTSWVWTDLKKCVEGRFKRSNTKYRFYAGDIYTAVAEKIQTVKQLEQRKRDNDEYSFQSEYLNIFLSENEDSFYNYADFEKNQVLENKFTIRTSEEYLSGDKNNYNYRENEIRYISSDIAMAKTTGSDNDNDNSVLCFYAVDLEKNHKKLEGIMTFNGTDTLEQAKIMKRAFYEYKATYFAFDTRTIGLPLFDMLNQPTYDDEYGIEYPSWSTCKDRQLTMCSEQVLLERIEREVYKDGQEVIVPIVSTAESNSQLHIAFRKALRDENISLLKDEHDMKTLLEDRDPYFITYGAEEKAKILLPFMETKFLINEAIALERKILDSGNIKLKETRGKTKDRYMASAYGNMFGDKLVIKYQKGEEQEDINPNDWEFLSGDYSNVVNTDFIW